MFYFMSGVHSCCFLAIQRSVSFFQGKIVFRMDTKSSLWNSWSIYKTTKTYHWCLKQPLFGTSVQWLCGRKTRLRGEARRRCALSPCPSHESGGRRVCFVFCNEGSALPTQREKEAIKLSMLHCFELWVHLVLSRCMVSSPCAFSLRKMAALSFLT